MHNTLSLAQLPDTKMVSAEYVLIRRVNGLHASLHWFVLVSLKNLVSLGTWIVAFSLASTFSLPSKFNFNVMFTNDG